MPAPEALKRITNSMSSTWRFIFVRALALLVLFNLSGCSTQVSGELIEYEQLPGGYIFLLFPAIRCGENLAGNCLNRIILVDKSELDSGRIVFSDNIEINRTTQLSSLNFLPDERTKNLLNNWSKTLAMAGYSERIQGQV